MSEADVNIYWIIAADGRLVGQTPTKTGFVPGRCIEVPPPECGPLECPFWTGDAWEVRTVGAPMQVPTMADLRPGAYPSIADQLDALWHAMDAGEIPKATAFYAMRKRVKDAYPKGVLQDVKIGRVTSTPDPE